MSEVKYTMEPSEEPLPSSEAVLPPPVIGVCAVLDESASSEAAGAEEVIAFDVVSDEPALFEQPDKAANKHSDKTNDRIFFIKFLLLY